MDLRAIGPDPTQRMRDIGDVRLAMDGAFETTVSTPIEPTVAPTLPIWQRPIAIAAMVLDAVVLTGLAVWILTRPEPLRVTHVSISTSPPPTVSGGAVPSLVISSDGTQVVYQSGLQIHVRAFDQLDAAPLRGAEGGFPFISPDGNWVGYWARQDRTLKKVSINGGPVFTITESDGFDGASWGRDDTIIFAMRAANTGLVRVSAAGGEPEPLTTLEEGETAHRWPEILPDGHTVLFTVVRGAGAVNMEIAALDLDTNERTLLVSGGSNPTMRQRATSSMAWAGRYGPCRSTQTGSW